MGEWFVCCLLFTPRWYVTVHVTCDMNFYNIKTNVYYSKLNISEFAYSQMYIDLTDTARHVESASRPAGRRPASVNCSPLTHSLTFLPSFLPSFVLSLVGGR